MNKYLEQLLEREVIARNEPASMLVDGNKRCNGRLIISSRRLIFICNGNEEPEVDIDLDTVNSIAHESEFVDHNILAITYLQYQVVRFTVIDCDMWEKTIEEQRMTAHIEPKFSIHSLN